MYSLRPGADVWLDADQFVEALQKADHTSKPEIDQLERAIGFYQGEYLPEALYETWAAEERERLETLFLENADKLVELYIEQRQYGKAIQLCQRVLVHDNCWERAYRHLMRAYNYLGDNGQIARTYQRCVQVLQDELGVVPSSETETLYRQLLESSKA
jgi:two-component SAPR family response regulator